MFTDTCLNTRRVGRIILRAQVCLAQRQFLLTSLRKNGRAYNAEHHATGEANDSRPRSMGHQSPLPKHPQTNMYLPKFLAGEAFEVVNRNTGCSYDNLLKTLEGRFGQAVQVTQACIVIN